MRQAFALIFLLLCCAGCAARKLPVTDGVTLQPTAQVDTLSATVSMSLRTAEKNLAGRGALVFQRPDRLRLVLLSPFGTTVMDTLVEGDRLSVVYPGSGVVFQGRFNELPPGNGQQGLALLRWVMDSDLPATAPRQGEYRRVGERGAQETLLIRDGVVVEKSLASGERVRYRNHAVLSGALLPQELLLEAASGERIRLTLEESEVNQPLELEAFQQRLQGLRLLPLSELKGS